MENMPMVAVTLGFLCTAALFLKLGYRGGFQSGELGSVSDQWVAAHRASEPASSM